MPEPLSLCIEDIDLESDSRYTRCVAVPGRQSGLGLNDKGMVIWKNNQDIACELWVSADNQLVLYRPEGAESLIVRRGDRHLEAPFDKPIIILNQDQVDIGTKHLRVHVHGASTSIFPPSILRKQKRLFAMLNKVLAVLILFAGIFTGGCSNSKNVKQDEKKPEKGKGEIEVRDHPPTIYFEK